MNLNPIITPTKITEQTWPDTTRPTVSVCCITYNHKSFIAKAIEGILMQETSFPVEIIIHDDASTDGTADIIRKYQKRYPKLIRAILQSENQYATGVPTTLRILVEASGSYVALCEGDDYWILPEKLQKQVDFMESSKQFAFCFHDAFTEKYDEGNTLIERSALYQTPPKQILKFDDFARGFAPPTSACLLRNQRDVFSWLLERKMGFVKTIFYALLEGAGRAAFLPEKMSVYRVHQGGIFSMISYEKQQIMSNGGLWVNRNNFTSKYYKDLFGVKLLENYIGLLYMYIQERRYKEIVMCVLRVIQLLVAPPRPRIIRAFTSRFFAYISKRISFS